ncbi:hypothetical protein [Piscinibacterium candidicorallinum]|jgi:hypothetical protein
MQPDCDELHLRARELQDFGEIGTAGNAFPQVSKGGAGSTGSSRSAFVSGAAQGGRLRLSPGAGAFGGGELALEGILSGSGRP